MRAIAERINRTASNSVMGRDLLHALPVSGIGKFRGELEALGFNIGRPSDGAYVEVTSPPGWHLRHRKGISFQIVDGDGFQRGLLFDSGPAAYFVLHPRYTIEEEREPDFVRDRTRPKDRWVDVNAKPSLPVAFFVHDDRIFGYCPERGALQFEPNKGVPSEVPFKDRKGRMVVVDHMSKDAETLFVTEWVPRRANARNAQQDACRAWLEENHSDHESILAHWGEQSTESGLAFGS